MKFASTALVVLTAVSATAFEQAGPGYEFKFPRDHFEHRDFGAEWWYYTGHLSDGDGRSFGFELTFFRAGLESDAVTETAWDLKNVYVAHFAITDVEAGQLYFRERVNRSGPGLAGASVADSAIWNGNWRVEYLPGDPVAPSQRLWAGDEHASVELRLEPLKPVVIHGQDGVSRKAGGDGQASHYTSFTRMQAQGTLVLEGEVFEVGGQAWMDHEFFTEGLAADLAGWDWMSIQLDDGVDLMLYGLRLDDGRYSEFSGGTVVYPDGQSLTLGSQDLQLAPGRKWRSPKTGAEYPVEWSIDVRRIGLALDVLPLQEAQEIVSESIRTPVYWEGPVEYSGQRSGKSVEGKGYLEMTGYDKKVVLGVR